MSKSCSCHGTNLTDCILQAAESIHILVHGIIYKLYLLATELVASFSKRRVEFILLWFLHIRAYIMSCYVCCLYGIAM